MLPYVSFYQVTLKSWMNWNRSIIRVTTKRRTRQRKVLLVATRKILGKLWMPFYRYRTLTNCQIHCLNLHFKDTNISSKLRWAFGKNCANYSSLLLVLLRSRNPSWLFQREAKNHFHAPKIASRFRVLAKGRKSSCSRHRWTPWQNLSGIFQMGEEFGIDDALLDRFRV